MPEALVSRLSAALAGRYTIERKLGQGGMATVYLADDLRHGRKVALKVLRPELAAVIGAERFLQEIRVTAALQHPHILPLHDSGEADTFLYYVMPFVEGESLRERLVRDRQLSLDDAVRLTTEVASALSYAHGRGVIHRDIKPENILVASGSAVVADFGIARAVTAAGGGRLTETGLSLGTPQYMSPEQATADRELDGRSDVYALGCVLYEMLTGEPPYTGPTAQSVISRLLTEAPRPVTADRPSVPAHVAAAVHTALARLPADRFRGAAEFADALQRPGPVSLPYPEKRALGLGSRSTVAVAALLALAATVTVWSLLSGRPADAPRPLVRAVLKLPDDGRLQVLGAGVPLALSPDTKTLVYASDRQLYVRPLDQLDATPLAGTEGATQPFLSPDGRQVGFAALGTLKRVNLAGGPPVILCQAPDFSGATWGPDDAIVFSAGGRLFSVPAGGGTPVAVPHDTTQGSLRWPEFLPGGKRVLATRGIVPATSTVMVELATGRVTAIPVTGVDARFVDGFLLTFANDGSGAMTPFDSRSGRTTGPAVPALEAVDVGFTSNAKLAVSRNGWVVYAPRVLARRRLVLVDRSGRETPIASEPAPFSDPRFSPSGREIAVTILEATGGLAGEIWVVEPRQGTRSRLTFEGAYHFPEWSADGRRIMFMRLTLGLLSAPAGGGPLDSLFTPPVDIFEGVLSGDGRFILYRAGAIPGDLYYVRRDSLEASHPLVVSRFDERAFALAPGDRWVAYVSNETGRDEVYVRGFPGGDGRSMVSSGGGTEPRWRRDARELFYRNGDTLFAVPVLPGRGFAVGPRVALFTGHYQAHGRHATYDVHPDGGRFVFVTGDPPGAGEVILVQNLAPGSPARRPR